MKIKTLVLKNFRSYSGEHRISLDDITVLVGKNDAGKSTILDALGVFFENTLLKGFGDSDFSVNASDDELIIGCEFDELPERLVLDASAETSLKDEFLLNEKGRLEILRVYTRKSNGGLSSAKIYARALHPKQKECSALLGCKLQELKKIASLNQIPPPENATIKAQWRKCIREHFIEKLEISIQNIPLDKEDGKTVYDSLKEEFPIYALFRADRSSSDEDSEAQDPLKIAVMSALDEVQEEIENIKKKVKERTLDVANRTLNKLHEFDPTLATSLMPEFKSEPKWDSLFKLTLKNENDISLNKRGSGVRRLVLFSFFRAEVERISQCNKGKNVFYAIEEPETAQHPDMQHLIIETLSKMSEEANAQILLTTHVPQLVSYVPIQSIRFITSVDGNKVIMEGGDLKETVLGEIANELGVHPSVGAKVALCVEGKHDIDFLYNINEMLINNGYDIVNIKDDNRVAVMGMGGSSLKDWVDMHYLKAFGIPEVHIYDSDIGSDKPFKYNDSAEKINLRGNRSKAFVTEKREMENYLHERAINEMLLERYGKTIDITIDDDCDVEKLFLSLSDRPGKKHTKDFLNRFCSKKMTVDDLSARNGLEEILSWFKYVTTLARNITAKDVLRY